MIPEKEIEKRTEEIKKDHAAMGWVERDNGVGRIDTMGQEQRNKFRDAALRVMR